MRNFISNNNEDSREPFAVYQHIILRNGWEYYLEQADQHGTAFGYVMGFANEWGCVSMEEIKPYITSIVRGDELNYIMPPEGYWWEDELAQEAWHLACGVLPPANWDSVSLWITFFNLGVDFFSDCVILYLESERKMSEENLPFILMFGATGIAISIAAYIVKSVLFYF